MEIKGHGAQGKKASQAELPTIPQYRFEVPHPIDHVSCCHLSVVLLLLDPRYASQGHP